jgi:hypothetical protein
MSFTAHREDHDDSEAHCKDEAPELYIEAAGKRLHGAEQIGLGCPELSAIYVVNRLVCAEI